MTDVDRTDHRRALRAIQVTLVEALVTRDRARTAVADAERALSNAESDLNGANSDVNALVNSAGQLTDDVESWFRRTAEEAAATAP